MHAPVTMEVVVERFALWRASLALMSLTVVVTLAVWLMQQGWHGLWAVLLPAVGTIGLLHVYARSAPFRLHWDGQFWHLSRPLAAKEPICRGQLQVKMDLGLFLLLYFRPESGGCRGPMRWLPVQRRGLESQWHGFRCILFARRAAPTAPFQDSLRP